MAAVRGGQRIVAADAAARAGGVFPGMPLTDARATLPALFTVEADPDGDLRALETLALWCGRYSPWTTIDAPEPHGSAGILVDASGCAHLFGGEAALLEDIVGRLRTWGVASRAALAETPGAAWAVARFGNRGTVAVVPPGGLTAALAPLPVRALRLETALADDLERVGLRRISDLTNVPRAPLATRFGQALADRLDLVLGRTAEPVSPRRPVAVLRTRATFPEPIADPADIAAATRRLLDEVAVHLADGHQGARRLELVAYRSDGTLAEIVVGTARPTRDPKHLDRLFAEKLPALDAGFGIDTLALGVLVAEPLVPLQRDLASGRAAPEDDAGRLVDRLGARLGPERVLRLQARASHIPERACRAVSAFALKSLPEMAIPGPRQPRPVRLLPTPEAIEVIAPVPDHPPVLFRWRRTSYEVARAEGPERIAPEWWLEGAPAPEQGVRDYFRVEDKAGRRYWLYREGVYLPGVFPRWYLHGFFA